jgi:hypothetical protein
MSKKVAIVQSNYIPWKGYFDMIAAVDEFILYDDMQYTRRDWRNRNQIKTPQGVQWLTVPVKVKGRYDQIIRDTEIDGRKWPLDHWKALEQNYRRAAHFADVASSLRPLYVETPHTHLSLLNRSLIEWVCARLGVRTRLSWSWDYALEGERSARLASLCAQAGASEYVSGPAARDYLDFEPFRRRGIQVTWFDYSGYPEYPQLWGTFQHGVTILDMLFNCGGEAGRYMKYVRACPALDDPADLQPHA